MTNREQILMRYICEGDMTGARKYTKSILDGTTTKKDEYFRETMLRKLEQTNFLNLPENLKNILVAEDSTLFPEKKFLIREKEEAIAEKVLSIYRYLNDYTLYVVEDITGTHTDPYHYKMYFHTELLPDVEVKP